MFDSFNLSSQNNIMNDISEMASKLNQLESMHIDEFDSKTTKVFSVDMNKGFAKSGALYSKRVEDLIPNTKSFIDKCLSLKIPVVAILDKHTNESVELQSYPKHCINKTEEIELVDELTVLKNSIIYKNSTNGFPRLDKSSIYDNDMKYIITGCCTDICIYQLALSLKAFINEYNINSQVIVPISLVDTYDAPMHNADLFNLFSLSSMALNGVKLVKDIIL